MATVYATNRGKRRSATDKYPVSPPSGGSSAKVFAEYVAAALQIADVINIATIPGGCSYRLREQNNAALGTSTTLSVGRSGAATEQLVATSTSAAATSRPTASFWRYAASDEDVIATLAGGAATGRIQWEIDVVRGNVATNQA